MLTILRGLPIVLGAFLLLWGLPAFADLPKELEDPECLGVNKEPAHATLMPYKNMDEAGAAKRHESSYARSLNGTWKFHWVAHPDQRPADFYKTDFDISGWADIPVPSCWQLLGYGTPYYRNLGYIFQKDWPRVMTDPPKDYTAYTERNPVGSYRREFEVPADWDGRRIFLTFDGVDSAFYLWINGQKVGYSVNSRNAAEFDVTKYVKPGKNMVAVEVYRFSDGTYLEDQDMWRLSGIYRNVTLWSAPQVHIRDFFVKTDLDKEYKDATLTLVAKVKNYGDKPTKKRGLSVQLFNPKGKLDPSSGKTVDVPPIEPGQETTVELTFPVTDPLKWTAETPNLYTAVLVFWESGDSNKLSELLSSRVGFRKVEIDGRVFKINGVAVKLKGANRHENWPDTGHYVTEAEMIKDIEVLKQCNCNHVRTCHYSDDPRWYELCDEYGLYLNAEANIESHGYGYGPESLSNPPAWKAAHIDRVTANVQNFKNHASVVMWSLGNEAGGGPNFVAALEAARKIDNSRPYHYERFGTGKGNPADVDSEMYTHPSQVERIAQDPNLTKPFYMCEYAHAMFNSMGSIGEYNDIFDKYPSLMGGAIWEWEDQGIWNRRDPKRPFIAYGGGFGEVPNDHYFIHKGVVFSDRSPKPHYPEAKHAYQWIGFEPVDLAKGQIKIKNKYAFTNLNKFAGSWTVSEDGKVVAEGKLEPLDLAPGAEQVLTIPTGKINAASNREYFLRLSFTLPKDESWAKAGFEVAEQQFKLPLKGETYLGLKIANEILKLTKADGQITVARPGFSVTFDKAEGAITKLQVGGKNLLVSGGGPKLHLWRAPHRNDDMWAYDDWTKLGLNDLKRETVKFDAEEINETAVRVEVGVMAEGKNGFRVLHSAMYTVNGDGTIAVENAVMFQGRRIPIARLGVRLLLDKSLDRFTYLGRGPMENYADRKRGFDVGQYSSTVRENMTPYAKPMECGNHEDVRWAAVTGNGSGLIAQAKDEPLQVSALPYTDEVMTPIEYTVDLPESESTVLTIATKTLGVGSNGCGPRPLDPYVIWSDPAAFSYVLRIAPGTENLLDTYARLEPAAHQVKPVLARRDSDGKVVLTSDTQGAKIEYNADGTTWTPYAGPFEIEKAAVISVRAKAADAQPYEGVVAVAPSDSRTKWKVTASSFEGGEGDPIHAIDNDPATFWHSRWSEPTAQPPHFLVVDFGAPLNVAAVVYNARRDMDHGHVKDYEVYLSPDGKTWGEPVANGAFPKGAREQTARLKAPVKARFLKFVILSNQAGDAFGTVAELSVIEAK